jgi:glycosyltransferase involved in cell wall biosynthesis
MADARLTVCIPAYNQPQYLSEALTSLCDQGLDRDDYVVVITDDASPAPLAEVVDAFRSRLTIVYRRFEQNIGHLANFDTSWKVAETPFISFLSHDDVVAPGQLGRALAVLDGDPSAVLVSSLILCQRHPGAVATHFHGMLLRGAQAPFTSPYRWARDEWMALASVATPNSIVGSIFRRDAFSRCHDWKAFPIWHDRLMLGEMGLHGSVYTLPWVGGHYRTGSFQLSGQLWQTDMSEFRSATGVVLGWCRQHDIPVADFWVDHICASPAQEQVIFLQMVRASFERTQFLDIKHRCEVRLQAPIHLSRLDRLGVPAPIASLLRTVDRLVTRRPS